MMIPMMITRDLLRCKGSILDKNIWSGSPNNPRGWGKKAPFFGKGASRNHVASKGGGGQQKGHERPPEGRGGSPKGHVAKIIEYSSVKLLR